MQNEQTSWRRLAAALVIVGGLLSNNGQSQGVDLVYDSATGNLVLDTADDVTIRSFRVGAKQPVFQVDRPDFLTHSHPPEYEFRLVLGSFQDVTIDSILQPGLDDMFLQENLCAYGFTTGHSEIRDISVNGQGALSVEGCGPPRNSTGTAENATVVLSYSAETGNLSFTTEGTTSTGDVPQVTALELISQSNIFTGDPVVGLNRLFEVDRDDKLFLLRPEGESGRDFGNAVATGLANSQFTTDVCVAGAWLGGGYVNAEFQISGAGRVPFSCGVEADTPKSAVEVAYAPESGELTVSILPATDSSTASAVAADLFTTIQVDSAAGLFVTDNGRNLGLEHDQITSARIIKQTDSGFDQLFLGAVLPTGLTLDELVNDITFDGTTLLGSQLESPHFVVPEPTGCWPLLITALWLRHRSRNPTRKREAGSRDTDA